MNDTSSPNTLKQSEKSLNEMVQFANSIILKLDINGTVTFFNDFACSFFGYKREEIVGKNAVGTIVPATDSSGMDLSEKISDLFKNTGHYASTENENICKDGRKVWVSWSNKALLNSQGETEEVLCVGNDITRLKQTEKALQRERDLSNAIFDTGGALQLVFDRDARIIRFNRACEQLTGYTFEEVRNQSFFDTLLPESEYESVSSVARSLLTKECTSNQFENHWISRTGEKRLISWHNTSILGDDEEVLYIVSTGIDITGLRQTQKELQSHKESLEKIVSDRTSELAVTIDQLRAEVEERIKTEKTLRESERRISTLLKNLPGMSYRCRNDEGWGFEFVSDGCKDLTGYSPEDLTEGGGVTYSDLILPQYAKTIKETIRNSITDNKDFVLEYQIRTKDGKCKWVWEKGRGVYSDKGELIALEGIIDDITDVKSAQEALADSEKRYRFLFEHSPAGNIVIDTDGIIRDVNISFIKSLGYEKRDLVGKPAMDFIPEEDHRHTASVLKKRFNGETIPPRDNQVIAKDGSVHYIVFSSNQTRLYENGKLTGVLITGTDVTEIRKAQALAKRHERQLIQADKMVSLGILVSGVAHEINNPNNFILLNSESMLDIWRDAVSVLDSCEAEKGEFFIAGLPYKEVRNEAELLLSGIGEGAERIKNIVNSLKDFARQDTGDMQQLLDINQIIESGMLILGNLIKKSTNNFAAKLDPNLPKIRGNRQQIEQVLINIITNSCQALRSTKEKITVSTHYNTPSSSVFITVSDEGRGIAQENLKHIMDPFFTTKRDSGGTGLGLSISYSIAKNHNGELIIKSIPGEGTTATVSLPYEKE
ncbi:PAS/PAC sensor signal transduction histidine kinase [Chitinispirillum alkaliphilum]|nr:PAS/PAC sensor signal transduction histidine kinase [Chitinispirillum alkaliphilum]